MAANVTNVEYLFIDRQGAESQVTLYIDSALPVDALWAFVDVGATRLQALSTAKIRKVSVFQRQTFTGFPDTDSDVSMGAVFYFENAMNELEPLFIVSPKWTLFEQTGPYWNIRIDSTQSDVQAFLAMVASGFGFRTKDGRTIGPTYIVGAVVL